MNKDYLELLNYLKDIGLENISKSEKKSLYKRLEKGVSLDQIKKELELLYSLNRILINTYKEVSIANMNRINNEIDSDLLLKLFVVYQGIKEKGLSRIDTLREFKKTVIEISKENKQTNLELENIVKIATTHLQLQQETLYFTMLSKEKADILLARCYQRAKATFQRAQISNLESVVGCLKQNFSLSDEELISISSQCATIFALSNASKLLNLETTLEDFKEYIKQQLTISNKSIDASKFLSKDFKDILTTSGSVAITDNKTLQNTIRFLKGERLGNLASDVRGELLNLKGNFTPTQLLKIYSKSLTCLSTPINKIAEACDSIYEAYNKHFNGNLSLDNFVNGRNFTSLADLRKEDYKKGEKIDAIFSLLSNFISKEDMQNLLENNFGFLKASVEDVRLGLEEAILESKNKDELQRNILKKIRSQFSREKGNFVLGERSNGIIVDKRKEVKVKDMQEEEIVSLLSKLKTSEVKIEKWRKTWNEDEKEYRELVLEEELLGVLATSKDLRDMLDFELYDRQAYGEEIEIIQELLSEMILERDAIVIDEKLNKNLLQINSQIHENIEYIKAVLNKKIDKLIGAYSSLIIDLNQQLEIINDTKDRVNDLKRRLEKKNEEIETYHIDEVEVKKERERLDAIHSLIEYCAKEYKKVQSRSNKTNDKIDFFANMLTSKEKREMLKDPVVALTSNKASAGYVFFNFLYILVRDDLIYELPEVSEVNLSIEEKNMSIEEYIDTLTKEEGEQARIIYDELVDSLIDTHEIFEKLCEKLEEYGLYNENIRTVKAAIKVLGELHSKLSKENREKAELLHSRSYIESEIEKYNTDELNEEIERLMKNIYKYNEKISNWSNKKM